MKTDYEKIPVEEIGELIDKASDKLPGLIRGLMGSLYSAQSGKEMGQAVGAFYQELIQSGISEDVALTMARDYMFSMREMFSSKNFSE